MKREQVIETLKNPHWFFFGKLFESDFEQIADAILDLPLDVPSDEEIEKTAMEYAPVCYIPETSDDVNAQIREEVEDLLKDMRDKIINRNK
jgi:hypothetical protein